MTNIVEINDSNYESVIKDNTRLLIDFYATWCGPCKMILPIFEEIAKDESIKTIIGKVNIDDAPEFTAFMGIRAVPSVFYFKDGKSVEKLSSLTKSNILDFIKKHETF